MRDFINKLNDGIVIISNKGEVKFSNMAIKSIFSLHEGDDIRAILKEDDKDVFYNNIISLVEKGRKYSNFMRFVNKKGELILCWFNVFKWKEDFVFEIFNLQHTKNKISTITDSNYIKILRYMSEGIAHSIRNPIMSAGGMLSRVKAKLKTDGEIDKSKLVEYIEVVERSLHRIISIIANLEVINNSFPVGLERVDLAEVINKILSKFEQRDIEFNVESERNVFVYINRMHISFVIEEILKNAVEALDGYDDGKIEISVYKDNGSAFFEVVDNGMGMAEEELSLTTIPFYSTKPSSMGIGLSLVKFLLEGYGGSISLESQPSVGTRVVVNIPTEKRDKLRVRRMG